MHKILVLDYGSQYTQLIARRIRELGVYCEIQPYDFSLEKIRAFEPGGMILSGGPSSVYADHAPISDKAVFDVGVPILGICYGLQMTAHLLGGTVEGAERREYGRAELVVEEAHDLFHGLDLGKPYQVWMSHGDLVRALPEGFRQIGRSESTPFCAIANDTSRIYGLQFHPEVTHTPEGKQILENFLFGICKVKADWNMASFIDTKVAEIRAQVADDEQVVLGLSGGVDSSVAAVLIHEAIGDRLQCIFVDNGLLRKGERERVEEVFRGHYHMALDVVDARERFVSKLAGVTDPERKRKIIGEEFVYVFEEEANKLDNVKWLAQGTLYPDVIESVSFKGPSAVIKSHHNVGGLPERMKLGLVEPLRELFKDEVRELGRQMNVPEVLLMRQPFPGPGLAVRLLGEITNERLDVLRDADAIVTEEIQEAGLTEKIWQSFAVLLPVKTVGVMGDERTYADVIALRAVHSTDGMTADWVPLPYELLGRISNRIVNEVRAVNRVVYDITSKPPGTIEWE